MNPDFEGMGLTIAIILGVIGLIWFLLKDSERKSILNTENERINKQKTARAAFTREFGEGAFDSTDFYLADRVIDYARAGDDKMETVKGVAGLLGIMKTAINRDASQSAAKLVKDQIENNRQVTIAQETQNPVYVQPPKQDRPIFIQEPKPRRVYYDHDPVYDDDIEYVPRTRRRFNHYF